MRSNVLPTLQLCTVILVAGCGTAVTYTETNSQSGSRPPRYADEVQVFMSVPPSRPYDEIGFIEAREASVYSGSDQEAVFKELRQEAGRRGCDGVIVQGADTVGSGFSVGTSATPGSPGTVGSAPVRSLRGYRGICIAYKDRSGDGPSLTTRTPEGAIGYRFGDSRSVAAAACKESGGEWKEEVETATCDQLQKGTPFAGRAVLTFCAERLCRIVVIAPFLQPSDEVVLRRWNDTIQTLAGKYGQALDGRIRVPPACRGRIAACIGTRQASYSLGWRWRDGARIAVSLEGPADALVLNLRYSSAEMQERIAPKGL